VQAERDRCGSERGAGVVSEPASQDKSERRICAGANPSRPFLVNPFASHIHSALLGQFSSEKTLARCEHPVWSDALQSITTIGVKIGLAGESSAVAVTFTSHSL